VNRIRVPEPLRSLARSARHAGWILTRTGSGHLRWQHPDGRHVITPSTPHGGNRSIRNARAELKRAGLTEETS
jgi:predicted RNA binding protein YcfA (HicA-like mRNA interferase family)